MSSASASHHRKDLTIMSLLRPADVSALGTVLGIWAHPDDEVYLSGGLMAMARDRGQRVVCVTATLGGRALSTTGPVAPHAGSTSESSTAPPAKASSTSTTCENSAQSERST